MASITPRLQGGFLHEVPLLPRARLGRPFKDRAVADVYSRTYEQLYAIQRARWRPALATRTSYSNLLLQSENFLTTWSATHCTPSAAQRANPIDGALSMSRILEDGTSNVHGPQQAYTFAAVDYLYSAYFASGLGRDWVCLWADDGTQVHHVNFNLTTGQVSGTATNCTGYIESQRDGSFRVWITFTGHSGVGVLYLLGASDATTTTYTGDTAKGFYGWGAQIELAAGRIYPAPYISTTTAARTISAPPSFLGAYRGASDFPAASAFLVEESDPDDDVIDARAARVRRTFAQLPADQVSPDIRDFSRPPLHDLYSSGSVAGCWAVSFDNLATSCLFFTRSTATALAAASGYVYLTKTAHGLAVGDLLAVWIGNRLLGQGPVYTVPDADHFYVAIDNTNTASASSAYYAKATDVLIRLANGTRQIKVRRTEKYYLPGVTPGTATIDQIPALPLYIDPIAWLNRILANTWSSTTATAATDQLTTVGAHGMTTGDTFFVLDLGGGAAGLSLRQYWGIVVDSTHLKAALTPSDALAGTAVNITTDSSAVILQIPAPYAAIAATSLEVWKGPILKREYVEAQLADALETRAASA